VAATACEYFADDANMMRVPSYTIVKLTAELRDPVLAANGWGVRGLVTVGSGVSLSVGKLR
jgi:hypothetical protein